MPHYKKIEFATESGASYVLEKVSGAHVASDEPFLTKRIDVKGNESEFAAVFNSTQLEIGRAALVGMVMRGQNDSHELLLVPTTPITNIEFYPETEN